MESVNAKAAAIRAVHSNRQLLNIKCSAALTDRLDDHSRDCQRCVPVILEGIENYARSVAQVMRNAAQRAKVESYASQRTARQERFERSASTLNEVANMLSEGDFG